jgi:glycerate kinase
VGSSGSKKSRKGGKRQHLDKVGQHTPSSAAREQQRERAAVMDVMGMGGAGGAGKALVWIVGIIFIVLAIVALLVLTVF